MTMSVRDNTNPTPWAVLCFSKYHPVQPYRVYLTEWEYNWQMSKPNSLWECPICGEVARWDDDNYEARIDDWEE